LENEAIIDVWVVKGLILDVRNGGGRGLLDE
jgi:C-terminal processing protease CtpA/Prc